MHNFYAASPINTYGTVLGNDYLDFLRRRFRGKIIDPNSSEVTSAVNAIKTKYPDRADYDRYGAKEVMDYFVQLTLSMRGGAGLALPMHKDGHVAFAIPAGVAKELATIHGNGYPTWIVTCMKQHIRPYAFDIGLVTSVIEEEVPSLRGSGKETLRTFTADSVQFPQLTIQETRERVYCWPDRTRLRSYFLEDAEPSAT